MNSPSTAVERLLECPHIQKQIEFLTVVPAAILIQLVEVAKSTLAERGTTTRTISEMCRGQLKTLVKSGYIDSSTSDMIVLPFVAEVEPVYVWNRGEPEPNFNRIAQTLRARIPSDAKISTRRGYWANSHTHAVHAGNPPAPINCVFEKPPRFIQPTALLDGQITSFLRIPQNNWINLAEIYRKNPAFFGSDIRAVRFEGADRAPLESHRFFAYTTTDGKRMASVFGGAGVQNHLQVIHRHFLVNTEFAGYRVH